MSPEAKATSRFAPWSSQRLAASSEKPLPPAEESRAEVRGPTDVVVAVALALGAAVLVALGPASLGPIRVVFAAAVVFFVPGYLLLEAAMPARGPEPASRLFRVAAAVGLSPAVVGLLALSTALVPGGFKPMNIVALVTLACVGLAALALHRRRAPSVRLVESARSSPPGHLGPRSG